MKKLVLEVLTTPWGKLLRVKEQEERDWVFTYDEFDLKSAMHPGIDFSPDARWVWGDIGARDNVILVVPSEEWLSGCRAAVAEYNRHFASASAPEPGAHVEVIE